MIFDVHQHLTCVPGSPAQVKNTMASVGIEGGAVFSRPPLENKMDTSCGFEERLSQVLDWCKGIEAFHPVLFIHPDEPDACKKAEEAAAKGIMAFKMIANSYYVSDEKALRLIETIAALGKPIFFHSGILYNGADSSKYNRPVFWEALIGIRGLRFSMAHCSWPWHDECIALYGKFLNHMMSVPDAPAMFFDLTPGTPVIYRRDLIYKLLHVGYDVENNIIWGTDNTLPEYNVEYAKHWLDIDNQLFDEFDISQEVQERIFHKNYFSFMGFSE